MKRAMSIKRSYLVLFAVFAAAVLTFSVFGCTGKTGVEGEEEGEVATYTVGGTVSGLNGTVVLQNNGADDLSITTDGSFTFATALADAATYNVTVLTQPVESTCLVQKGSGTISAANVTDVSVICKSWTKSTDLNDNISPDGQDATYPQVAMDASGNTIVVWQQSDGTNTQIYKSEYRNGAWLPHPSNLANDHISLDGQNAEQAQVAMDDNGNAIIVWRQSDGANVRVYKCEYRNGAWCAAPDIGSIPIATTDAYSPKVAMDNNGNAIIIWGLADSSVITQIFKSEYRNGSWTIPSNIDDNVSPDGQFATGARVAMDDNENAIIVWEQSDNSKLQIFKAEYRDGGPWKTPANLDDNISPNAQDAYSAQVAMGDGGSAIIVWAQSDNANAQIFKAEYRGGGPWMIPSNLSDNVSPNGQSAGYPQVAMDDNGNAIIVWVQSDSVNEQVFKAEYRGVGPWTVPSDLNDNISPNGQDIGSPQVAMDNMGNAVVVWVQDDGANGQVFKAEYYGQGPWTVPSDLSDNISIDGQNTYEPRVAIGDNGDAIIVWQQSNGVNSQIFMSEFR